MGEGRVATVATRENMKGNIPLIDLACLEQAEISKQIGAACRDWGAFYIKNHGIELENLLSEVRNFFNATIECKEKSVPKRGVFGYFHKGAKSTAGKRTFKEGLYFRSEYPNEKLSDNETLCSANQWPNSEEFPNYRKTISEYLLATRQLAFKLAECMSVFLGLEKSHFSKKLTEQPFQQIGI